MRYTMMKLKSIFYMVSSMILMLYPYSAFIPIPSNILVSLIPITSYFDIKNTNFFHLLLLCCLVWS